MVKGFLLALRIVLYVGCLYFSYRETGGMTVIMIGCLLAMSELNRYINQMQNTLIKQAHEEIQAGKAVFDGKGS
jgi:hypothetical protein